jgi:hypothetical protein
MRRRAVRQRRTLRSLPPRAAAPRRERAMVDQCCSGDAAYLLLQINIICLLLALIGSTAIMKHPAWFGEVPATIAQNYAQR